MAKRKQVKAIAAAFWDTSAIIPLCCFQPQSSAAMKAARQYNPQIVWWITSVEAVSGFQRLSRDSYLTAEGHQQAVQRLAYLRQRWNEVQPTEEVRNTAERLLAIHPLRAADALQLAAALIWCSRHTQGRHFVGSDGNLCAAAEKEGFTVVRVS
jgi:predicted nucleic acid-binding protein